MGSKGACDGTRALPGFASAAYPIRAVGGQPVKTRPGVVFDDGNGT